MFSSFESKPNKKHALAMALAVAVGLTGEVSAQQSWDISVMQDSVFSDFFVDLVNNADHSSFGRWLAGSDQAFSSEDKCAAMIAYEDAQHCVVDEDCDQAPFIVCGSKCPGVCSHKNVFPTNT